MRPLWFRFSIPATGLKGLSLGLGALSGFSRTSIRRLAANSSTSWYLMFASRHMLIGWFRFISLRINLMVSKLTVDLVNPLRFPLDPEGPGTVPLELVGRGDARQQLRKRPHGFDFRGDLGVALELPLLNADEKQENGVGDLVG